MTFVPTTEFEEFTFCSTMRIRCSSRSFICLAWLISASSAFVSPKSNTNAAASRPSKSSPLPRIQSFGDFKGITDFFKPKQAEVLKPIKPKFDTVLIEPDYRAGILLLGLGGILDTIPYVQLLPGPFVTLLGLLFVVQAARIRLIFDEDSIELLNKGEQAGEFKSSGDNIVVGGANRWRTDAIVNYDFFPKGWIDGPLPPLLIYFKETQTDSTTWNEGPGAKANDPELIAKGKAVAGQVHFFPAVCNAKQVRSEFEKRGCGRISD